MEEMEINDCWSLIAVVKECARKAKLAQLKSETTSTTTTTTTTKSNPFEANDSRKVSLDQYIIKNNTNIFVLPSAAAGVVNNTAPSAYDSSSKDELKDMYIPYQVHNNHHGPIFGGNTMDASLNQTSGVSSRLVVDPSLQDHLGLQNIQKQGSFAVGVDHHCMHKKKKFEDRWVVRFTSEELAKNDKWAWRKYGQKPIKGSPYPRNYYRCSSMKGCKARKQVERSPIEQNLYVVTYTSHHLHPCPPVRNANGTRVKFTGSDPYPQPKIESPTSIVPDPIRPWYGSGLGGYVAKVEHEEILDEEVSSGANAESFGSGESINNNYDYEILIPNSMVDSDLLTGMDQLSGSGSVKCVSGGYSQNLLQ